MERNMKLALIVIVLVSVIMAGMAMFVLSYEEPRDTEPPGRVTGLEVVDLREGRLLLTWNEPQDNLGVERYFVRRDGNKLPYEPRYPFYIDTDLQNWQVYYYQVLAVDGAGNEGNLSDVVSGMPTPADNIPPERVLGLSVVNAFHGRLNLSWEESYDNQGVAKYRVYRDGVKLQEEPEQPFFQDRGLTNGRVYTYQVSAVDFSGNEGRLSESKSGKPTETDIDPPEKVTSLKVTDARNGRVNLSWEEPWDNVGVEKYNIYRDGMKLVTEPNVTHFEDTGLVNGHAYSYQVSAVDGAGNEGEKSDPIIATPTSTEPEVTFFPPTHNETTYFLDVGWVSEIRDLSCWESILIVDGIPQEPLKPLRDGNVTADTLFLDIDGGGNLTIGDRFVVSVEAGHYYELRLYWIETGNERARVTWSV